MRLKHFTLSFGTQIFKSFADESRTRILHLLYQQQELTVSDLVYILNFTQTKTSRHMAYLKAAGVVNARKLDQWVFYSIRDEGYHLVTRIFDFLEKDTTLQKDLETAQTMRSNRELAINRLEAKDYRN